MVFTPVVLSWQIYRNVENGNDTLPYALVQPNLDPYTEKFIPTAHAQHLNRFLDTADRLCDENTRILIGPETQIVAPIDEKKPQASWPYRRMRSFQQKYPDLSIILGAHSFERLNGNATVPGSRYDAEKDIYYEAFNAALFLPQGSNVGFYHKTKLVPLFERMPFVQYLGFLGRFSLELGGYSGTYSNRQAQTVFQDPEKAIAILPIVCFESVFGGYNAQRLSPQRGFIAMLTNDGWWKGTPGYRHHFSFSRMRAIESRREMIRAANNGISAHIDARGRVVSRTAWWQAATLKGRVHLRAGQTFFSRHGDFLGRAGLFCALGLLFYAGIRRISR
jgi:apolipoprotein N-acyltransferase